MALLRVGDATVTTVQELAMPTSARWLLPDAPEPFAILERARPAAPRRTSMSS
jgi:hypothetical protein